HFLHNDPTSDTANYNATVTLRQPAFLSPRHTASLAVFAERRSEFQAYTREAVGANLAVTLNARRNVPVTIAYTYSIGRTTADLAVYCIYFRVCNEADSVFLAPRRSFGALSVTAVRYEVNSVLDPTVGSTVRGTLLYASRHVLSDPLYEFSRGEVEISRYYALSRRSVLAWRVRGGTILPPRLTLSGQSTQFVPPDQRFYAGGPNSVRGYALNELGPRVYVQSIGAQASDTIVRASPTGGNTVFTANLELRIATPILPERVRFGLFVDVGQVWARGDTVTAVRGLRVTPGLGLRFVTPLGPVRFDAAYNGYPQEPGPLYFLNTRNGKLTKAGVTFQQDAPAGLWRRIVLQFAVGQAF
ncbi:MAG TPA: BamA/TamA family outer membrane protein, partial [Gemmatimonadales bacterium]|nr:BamA/TamA family outer membrane protein [Gemmatimonadales bacterium]